MDAAQQAHEEQLTLAGLSEARRLKDGAPTPDLREGPLHVCYVGNLVVMGLNEEEVGQELDKAKKWLELVGLKAHEVELPALKADVIGG